MKKVSVNKWKKMLPKKAIAEHEATVHFNGNEETMQIVVTSNLTMMDRMAFAKDIVESCFDEISGDYIPYAFDVAFAVNLIQYFTNVDVGDNAELAFALTEQSDIISIIKDVVNEKTMDQMETEVYELLQWQKSRRKMSTKADELYDAIISLVNKFSDMADSAKDNLDEGNIINLAEAVKQIGDQEDLVKAIIKANKDK